LILEVKNLSHTYMPGTAFSSNAVSEISFKLSKGEFIGLIGHSGSGKSTLIQHLNGLLSPTEGDVILDGKSIFSDKKSLKEARSRVGLVFQYPEQQLFEETVYKDIAFGPLNMGLSKDETRERVMRACALSGVKEELLLKSPFDLSGGQKRRVAIAGVIAMNPEILILDEPAAGLDPKTRNKILSSIRELRDATGMTVILVSHSMEDIANNADRIMVMNKGSLVMDGSRDEIFAHMDELSKIGLGIPQVSRIVNELREKGYRLPENIYTVSQAKREIMKFLGKGDN